MKLYVKFDKPDTIKEFLEKFFVQYDTESNKYIYYGTETFYDKECLNQQCPTRRLRSFDDVFDCVETYFPEVTPKNLIHELLVLQPCPGKILNFGMGNCSTIKRIRMHYQEPIYLNFPDREQYDSRFSWQELLLLLNIKNAEDLAKYLQENRK